MVRKISSNLQQRIVQLWLDGDTRSFKITKETSLKEQKIIILSYT